MNDYSRPSLFRLLCCLFAVSPLLLLGVLAYFDNDFGYLTNDGSEICTKYLLDFFGEDIPKAITIDNLRLRLYCIIFLSVVIVFLREGIFHFPSEDEYLDSNYDFINEIKLTYYCASSIILRCLLIYLTVFIYCCSMKLFTSIEEQRVFDVQMLPLTIPLSIFALFVSFKAGLAFQPGSINESDCRGSISDNSSDYDSRQERERREGDKEANEAEYSRLRDEETRRDYHSG